jgi:hypothetical protein
VHRFQIGKHMKYLLITVFTFLTFDLAAQTYTARQLYDEYHRNEYNFEKQYLNKTITLIGKVRSVKQGIKGLNANSAAFITATGYENFIAAQFPIEDVATPSRLNADEFVTVTGTCSAVVRDAMVMKNCIFSTGKPTAEKVKNIPVEIPLGIYNIYQANGSTFNFQYKLTLSAYTSYTVNNVKGAARYDSKAKVIYFKSGLLKGFTGIYRPVNPDNEKDPPTIVIDPKGAVPDLQHQHGKTYLLGYLQQ